jgi:hypothetical protein
MTVTVSEKKRKKHCQMGFIIKQNRRGFEPSARVATCQPELRENISMFHNSQLDLANFLNTNLVQQHWI